MKKYIILRKSYGSKYEMFEFSTQEEMASFLMRERSSEEQIPCQRLFARMSFDFVANDDPPEKSSEVENTPVENTPVVEREKDELIF